MLACIICQWRRTHCSALCCLPTVPWGLLLLQGLSPLAMVLTRGGLDPSSALDAVVRAAAFLLAVGADPNVRVATDVAGGDTLLNLAALAVRQRGDWHLEELLLSTAPTHGQQVRAPQGFPAAMLLQWSTFAAGLQVSQACILTPTASHPSLHPRI